MSFGGITKLLNSMKLKITLTIATALVFSVGFSQQKNYQKKNNAITPVKIYGERVELQEATAPPEFAAAAVLPLLGGLVADHGLSFAKNQIKNSLKKYTGEYAASTTVQDPNAPQDLKLVRSIKAIGSRNLVVAAQFDLSVNIDSDGFYYIISVDQMEYSKAKLKSKYYFLDLAFEVEVTYLVEGGKKTSVKSKPIYYSLFDFLDGTDELVISTDRFPTGKVSEVSVKVTESNPYKIKLEKIQGFLDDNDDLLSDLLGKLK